MSGALGLYKPSKWHGQMRPRAKRTPTSWHLAGKGSLKEQWLVDRSAAGTGTVGSPEQPRPARGGAWREAAWAPPSKGRLELRHGRERGRTGEWGRRGAGRAGAAAGGGGAIMPTSIVSPTTTPAPARSSSSCSSSSRSPSCRSPSRVAAMPWSTRSAAASSLSRPSAPSRVPRPLRNWLSAP